jgi:hypothetical protein
MNGRIKKKWNLISIINLSAKNRGSFYGAAGNGHAFLIFISIINKNSRRIFQGSKKLNYLLFNSNRITLISLLKAFQLLATFNGHKDKIKDLKKI